MSPSLIRRAACLIGGGLFLVAGPGAAQYYGSPRYHGDAPQYYGSPEERYWSQRPGETDLDPYDPYAAPARRRPHRDAYQYDPETDAEPAPAPRGNRRARLAALPPDADPDYSTPLDLDSAIDRAESTKRLVEDPTGQRPGTLTIDTGARKLYLSLADGRAIEYGVGVGREGFAWKGVAEIGRKAYWPGWTPPREMLLRRPDLPSHMEGGMENPLGARALYLFRGAKDTMFRIHGTNEPDTIGKAVSSGCIRMLNADVIDLYERVKKGARVVVM